MRNYLVNMSDSIEFEDLKTIEKSYLFSELLFSYKLQIILQWFKCNLKNIDK